jgi:hypothetical protein
VGEGQSEGKGQVDLARTRNMALRRKSNALPTANNGSKPRLKKAPLPKEVKVLLLAAWRGEVVRLEPCSPDCLGSSTYLASV